MVELSASNVFITYQFLFGPPCVLGEALIETDSFPVNASAYVSFPARPPPFLFNVQHVYDIISSLWSPVVTCARPETRALLNSLCYKGNVVVSTLFQVRVAILARVFLFSLWARRLLQLASS
jgi:hypothetical protein